LRLAGSGFAVFPIAAGEKRPALPKCPQTQGLSGQRLVDHAASCSNDGHSFYDATTDEHRIRAWWADENPNVGVATGSVSNLLVIDVDSADADKALADAGLADLPPTAEVQTPHGLHLWFAYPSRGEFRNTARRLGDRIDTRGAGGYVVGPSSVVDEVEYTGTPRPLAEVPEHVLERLRGPAETPGSQQSAQPPLAARYADGEAGTAYGLAALQAEAEALAGMPPDSGRNVKLNEAAFKAFQLVAGGELAREHAQQTLTSAANKCGLDGREIESTMTSGMSAGLTQPRSAPVTATVAEVGEGRPSQATELVALAKARYRLRRSDEGEPFGVPREGPRVVRMLRGASNSLRAELAKLYHDAHGKVPSNSALADALTVLEGEAQAANPTTLHVRVARHEDGLVVDLGDDTGRAVLVGPDGWQVVASAPVLFRRTKLTGALPDPRPDSELLELRTFLNVTDRDYPLLVGWLIAALIPDIAHPLLVLTGEQGTGKTTAGRTLALLVDPSPAPTSPELRNLRSLAVVASASWVRVLDNLSGITPELSDALCQLSTGGAWLDRALYTDADVSVLNLRRCIVLTSIDPGALRGDLADRLLSVELQPFGPSGRRAERALATAWQEAHPRILGALLDLLVQVLAVLPQVGDSDTRMADFAQILTATDKITGSSSLDTYLEGKDDISRQVLEGDPVAAEILALVEQESAWAGTITELLRVLRQRSPDAEFKWPRSAKSMSQVLKRAAPALRACGIRIEETVIQGRRVKRLVLEGLCHPQ
jgi:hypothetical protein